MNIKIQNKIKYLVLGMLIAIPLQVRAYTLVPDQQIRQGESVQLLIPKFDFTEASATFEGKPVQFYEMNKNIDPNTPITRAEFLQLIYLNSPNAHTNTAETSQQNSNQKTVWSDVPATSQYHSAIEFATKSEIVSGYEDGLFHPFESVTRAQASKIIMNAFEPAETLQNIPEFSDVPSGYSLKEFINKAVRAGVFKGYPDGKMLPDRAITFHEANLIIQRAGQLSNPQTISERPTYRAFIGINRLSDLGVKKLQLKLKDLDGNKIWETPQITVTRQNFAAQHFDLAEDRNKLFGQSYQDKTWELIDAAKSQTSPEQLWEGAFAYPTNGRLTVGYGDKLYINNKYAGSHFGLDIANKEGTDVKAANTGIVTMSSDTAAYGNTIVIDHGQNVFTMYLHLAELKVKAGDKVKKNDVIAGMGSTGLATGSHLHFTNFVGDIVVSPVSWFEGKF